MGTGVVPIVILGALLGIAFGLLSGWFLKGRLNRTELKKSRGEAQDFIKKTRREAETQKRQALLNAKEEWLATKGRLEGEIRGKAREAQLIQRRLEEREANQRDRDARLGSRERDLDTRARELDETAKHTARDRSAAGRLAEELNDRLAKITGLTLEDAKQMLLTNMRQEVRFEAATLIRNAREEAQKKAEMEAGKIVSLAIERTASDWSAERSVSTLQLPNEKLKGRIIGHEGKNIRAFEKMTGVQLLMDDQPGAVVLSCFNPIKREVARLTLERLIKDGNISPRRIEEMVAKFQRRVEDQMLRAGQDALKELEIMMGLRLKLRSPNPRSRTE